MLTLRELLPHFSTPTPDPQPNTVALVEEEEDWSSSTPSRDSQGNASRGNSLEAQARASSGSFNEEPTGPARRDSVVDFDDLLTHSTENDSIDELFKKQPPRALLQLSSHRRLEPEHQRNSLPPLPRLFASTSAIDSPSREGSPRTSWIPSEPRLTPKAAALTTSLGPVKPTTVTMAQPRPTLTRQTSLSLDSLLLPEAEVEPSPPKSSPSLDSLLLPSIEADTSPPSSPPQAPKAGRPKALTTAHRGSHIGPLERSRALTASEVKIGRWAEILSYVNDLEDSGLLDTTEAEYCVQRITARHADILRIYKTTRTLPGATADVEFVRQVMDGSLLRTGTEEGPPPDSPAPADDRFVFELTACMACGEDLIDRICSNCGLEAD